MLKGKTVREQDFSADNPFPFGGDFYITTPVHRPVRGASQALEATLEPKTLPLVVSQTMKKGKPMCARVSVLSLAATAVLLTIIPTASTSAEDKAPVVMVGTKLKSSTRDKVRILKAGGVYEVASSDVTQTYPVKGTGQSIFVIRGSAALKGVGVADDKELPVAQRKAKDVNKKCGRAAAQMKNSCEARNLSMAILQGDDPYLGFLYDDCEDEAKKEYCRCVSNETKASYGTCMRYKN